MGCHCPSFFHHVRFQLTVYTLGFLAGIAALTVFSIVSAFRSIPAAILGGISAIYAGALVLDIWKTHSLQDGRFILPLYETKTAVMIKLMISVLGTCAGALAFIFYTVKYVYLGDVKGEASFFACIQGWMLFKWALSSTVHIYRHHNYHSPLNRTGLLQDEDDIDTPESA
eukprot:TRINITY_DN2510_c0_g1_i2.p1 TRINITY_DN2510_c0_g1~~TRINITY_DN2510_c0_g1_i2.p1  ORF type:complete len:170 (+),score=16.59 TRINITY_DN2510_c0_g1_i2:150-659(+)